jgi:hypothetical protein
VTDDRHLDLDALSDALADDANEKVHLAGCADCRAALADLQAAQGRVAAELGALPAVPLPADVAARLQSALRDGAATAGTGTVTTLPTARRDAMRWLPAAAAVVVLLAGAAFGISRLGNDSTSSTSAAGSSSAKSALNLRRNNTGTDYTDRASIAAAVPGLLDGSRELADSAKAAGASPAATTPQRGAPPAMAQAAADPLERLRTEAGLADCLVALLPPDDPSVLPLAIDYATFRGTPAMVVVLPGATANKLDIFVVGPGCSRANDSTLFYTSVGKP